VQGLKRRVGRGGDGISCRFIARHRARDPVREAFWLMRCCRRIKGRARRDRGWVDPFARPPRAAVAAMSRARDVPCRRMVNPFQGYA
jgi:hypothetical protein